MPKSIGRHRIGASGEPPSDDEPLTLIGVKDGGANPKVKETATFDGPPTLTDVEPPADTVPSDPPTPEPKPSNEEVIQALIGSDAGGQPKRERRLRWPNPSLFAVASLILVVVAILAGMVWSANLSEQVSSVKAQAEANKAIRDNWQKLFATRVAALHQKNAQLAAQGKPTIPEPKTPFEAIEAETRADENLALPVDVLQAGAKGNPLGTPAPRAQTLYIGGQPLHCSRTSGTDTNPVYTCSGPASVKPSSSASTPRQNRTTSSSSAVDVDLPGY